MANEAWTPEWWSEQRQELRRLSARVFDLLDKHSVVQVGFLPRSFLDEFVSGCFVLIDILIAEPREALLRLAECTDVNSVRGLEELKATSRRLCQLSRDILFSVDGDRLAPELTDTIQRLFVLVGRVIPCSADQELDDYRNHIETRRLQVGHEAIGG